MNQNYNQVIAGAMLAELARHGWGQGQSVNAQGNICAGKALDLALNALNPGVEVIQAACQGLSKTGRDLFPERVKEDEGSDRWDLIDFNDHPGTTLEDVQLVVKHWAAGR